VIHEDLEELLNLSWAAERSEAFTNARHFDLRLLSRDMRKRGNSDRLPSALGG